MIFSKTALFSAAAILGVPATMLGYAEDIKVGETTGVDQGGVKIETAGTTTTITVEETANISGAILDKNGAISSTANGLTDFILGDDTGNKEKLVFTGGGTVEYTGGSDITSGLDYYKGFYQLNRDDQDVAKDNEVWENWEKLNSFWSNEVFTGTVEVKDSTVLNLAGQLSQYVELYQTRAMNDTNGAVERKLSGIIGVSKIKLSGQSTLSFEGSNLNLMDSRPSMGSTNPTSGYTPEGVLALNFVNNLQADTSSIVIIGTDDESRNRIVFNADKDEDNESSTVGVLRGNGRIYTMGAGTISFLGRSELNSGSILGDTTGDLWKDGTRLADVILGTGTVNLGNTATAVATTRTVKNVLDNATAVQLVGRTTSSSNAAISTLSTSYGVTGSIVTGTTNSGSTVNGGANYVGEFGKQNGADADTVTVNVYGEQIFNNFQSLWVERTELLATSVDNLNSLTGMMTEVFEPVKFAYRKTDTNGDYYSQGYGTEVVVKADSVLTLHQETGRDGYYTGDLDTKTNGGLIVKTGDGRIAYSATASTSTTTDAELSNLRIEGGEWIQLGSVQGTHITLAETGAYRMIVSDVSSTSFRIQAVDKTAELILARGFVLENGLTTATLDAVDSGTDISEIDENDRYRKYNGGSSNSAQNAGLQITSRQNMFYGSVLVEDSLKLTLGGENSSKSIFGNASEIVLNGSGAVQNRYSELIIRDTQLVRNLKGTLDRSSLRIESGATLVLTKTSDSDNTYTGGITSQGNLVLLGVDSPVQGNLNGELTGALVLITGSATVYNKNASTGLSGLVMKSGTSATFNTDARVGALIGESGSSVNISGRFTVGGNAGNATADGNGSYFATADYSSYEKYFKGTGLEVNKTLETDATDARRIKDDKTNKTATVAGTLNFVKNPAELIFTRETSGKTNGEAFDPTKTVPADGAFREVFTSTGKDSQGTDVFSKMVTGDPNTNNGVFRGATTVAGWLTKVFTNENNGVNEELETWLKSEKSNNLSVTQKEELRNLALTIAGSTEGVNTYLDGAGNINTVGWNAIVAAGGLEYFKYLDKQNETDTQKLQNLEDDSLYSFIKAYYSDYGFVLTEAVAAQISAAYGVDSSAWTVNNKTDYAALYNSFGVSSTEFAGTLFGSGSLVKEGAESLQLTNSANSFTGTTTVKAGELYTTRTAIKNTSGLSVENGALLTISANQSDKKSSGLWDDTVITYGNGYSEYLENSDARLTGTGTVLKIGDGNVALDHALSNVTGDTDFTGDFVIYDGALRVTIDAQNRMANNNALGFDIYFSDKNETKDATGKTTTVVEDNNPVFDIVFSTATASSVVAELDFTGKVSGSNGTLTLNAGKTSDESGNLVGNNILRITNDATKNFSIGTIELKSGALKFSAFETNGTSTTSTNSTFKTVKMASKTGLMFDMFSGENKANMTISEASIAISESSIEGTGGNLIVSGTTIVDKQTDKTSDVGGTLTLKNTTLAGISSIEVLKGATLKLDVDDGNDTKGKEKFSAISTEAGTTLEIGSGYEVTLEKDAVLAGALKGSGTLIFEGENLTLGSAETTTDISDAFTGTISIPADYSAQGVTINFAAGGTVSYKGLTIKDPRTVPSQKEELVLQKTGAGKVEIKNNSGKTNYINSENFSFDVQEGELSISGCVFDVKTKNDDGTETTKNSMSGLVSTYIAKNATLSFVDDFGGFATSTNNAMIFKSISGSGTLKFNSTNTVTVNVDEFSPNEGGSQFTGVVDISKNTTLTLGEKVTEFAALAGEGTVNVKANNFTIRTDANENGESIFSGTLSFNGNGDGGKTLNIVGDGVAAFSKDSIKNCTTINIGATGENGGVGVASDWSGTINANGETSRVIVFSNGNGSSTPTTAVKTTATVNVADAVKNLKLSASGEIALGGNAVATAFNLKDSNGSTLDLSGESNAPAVELSNYYNGTLTLKNLPQLSAEKFTLKTVANSSGGDGLVFSGATATNSRNGTRDVSLDDTKKGTWAADISGDGNVVISGGADLTLTANTLSYTGETSVSGDKSILRYATESGASTVSYSKSLKVESGATLVGGVDLVADDADVTLYGGSTFIFTGNAIRFTGTAKTKTTGSDKNNDSKNKVNVILDSQALTVRGTPVALIEHIGDNSSGGNQIMFSDLNFGYYVKTETTEVKEGGNETTTTEFNFKDSSYELVNKTEKDSSGKITITKETIVSIDGEASQKVLYYKDADAATNPSALVIYVATDNLETVPGVSYHSGIDSKFLQSLSKIATPTADGKINESLSADAQLLAEAIIKTPNSSLAETVLSLTPMSYAAMPALMQSGFLSDISAVSSRIEHRRYDNYSTFIWEIKNDWEFFVQAQGMMNEADDATDSRVFDLDTYGAIAGMDVKLSATSVLGFALACDYGNADIHNGGGEITSYDTRATGFFGTLFADRFYLDLGLQAGYAAFDIERNTATGRADGTANGFHGGAFATLGALFPLWISEDEKSGINLMPFINFSASYYNVDSVDESGAGTALKVESFDAMSLRATVGTSFVWTTPMFDKNTRVNVDFSYSRELGDDETDIDFTANWDSSGEKFTVAAPTFASDTFAIAPRFTFDLSRDSSIYAGYRFEATTDSDISHSVNLGFRTRF